VSSDFSNEILHQKSQVAEKIHNQKHLTGRVKHKILFLENRSIDFMAMELSQ
jgi:hypothetical protein